MHRNVTEILERDPAAFRRNPDIRDIDEEIEYKSIDNYEDSLYGAGGFVFVFDRKSKKDRTTGLTLHEVLEYEWSSKHQLASVGVDWVMFNPNYNVDVYCALEF